MTIFTTLIEFPTWIPLILAMAVSLRHIYKHLSNFNQPKLQLYIVRIIIIIPIYSLKAFLSIQFPGDVLWFDCMKDCYEAYVIYIFLSLLIQYMDGEATILKNFESKERMAHPWPFSLKFAPFKLTRQFFKTVKRGIMQFVFVKPCVSFSAVVLSHFGLWETGVIHFGSPHFVCLLIGSLSMNVSLTSLVYFYMATKDKLIGCNPLGKFVMIKLIVFLSFWQSLGIAWLLRIGYFGDPLAFSVQVKCMFYRDFAILNEMVLMALLYSCVFRYQDFEDWTKSSQPILGHIGKVLSMHDLIKDAKVTFVDPDEEYETPLTEMERRPNDTDPEQYSFKSNMNIMDYDI